MLKLYLRNIISLYKTHTYNTLKPTSPYCGNGKKIRLLLFDYKLEKYLTNFLIF